MLLPDLEIRAYLSRYLAGSLSLDAFEDWFVPETWHIERYGDRGARTAAEVRSMLFRVSTGEAAEDAFRAFAREKVNEVVFHQGESAPRFGADSETHDPVKTGAA